MTILFQIYCCVHQILQMKIFDLIGMRAPPFYCRYTVSITHERSFLCPVVQLFIQWIDWVYITSKCYEFTNAVTLPYHAKLGELLSNAMCIFHLYNLADVSATQYHFFVFINVKDICSNHVVNYFIALFIISIDPLGINISSFNGYAEFINKKVGNIWLYS